MSEEEAKAIIELRHYINITEYWKQKEYTNSEIDNYIKIVLNSLEKQQKEIDRLNRKQADDEMLKDTFIERDYISRNKIREKIKEIDGKGTFDAKIVLEHLLEEN